MSEVRSAIEKQNAKFGDGFRKGDPVAVAALYTEDAVLLPPNAERIKGKHKITEYWRTLVQAGVKEAVLTTEEVSGSGDMVQELGNYYIKIQPEGGTPSEDKGKYIVIWKKTSEGWKLHWDIWNSNMPPRLNNYSK